MEMNDIPNQPVKDERGRSRSKDRVAAMHADWQRRWPAVFTEPVPLASGIARLIRAETGEPRHLVGVALHRWTMKSAYLRAVGRGDMRRNLDGSPAGEPDEAQREEARRLLKERTIRQSAGLSGQKEKRTK